MEDLFDTLNPAFQDAEAYIPELDMDLMEGDYEDETDEYDEYGIHMRPQEMDDFEVW